MRGLLGLAMAVLLVMGCSQATPAFSVAGATVDDIHTCPAGAINSAYKLHATIDTRNPTSKPVTIEAATARMKLAKVTGPWLEAVGDVYDAGTVAVSPARVPASSKVKLDVTIPSACTSGRYGKGAASSGDYTVTVRLVTSAGTFSVVAANRHEIVAA